MKKLLSIAALVLAFFTASAQAATIRALFAYTPQAAAWLSPYVSENFDISLTEVVTSFTNSGISGLSIVRSGNYALPSQEANVIAQWNATRNNIGVLIAHDFQNADVVVTVTYFGLSNDECGEANGIGNPADMAFVVVDVVCMLTTKTLQHELGHLMGGRHNRDIDPYDFPYAAGHGWQNAYYNGSNHFCFHDIMAYKLIYSPNDCTDNRVNYWSNQNMYYPGAPPNGAIFGNAYADLTQVVGAVGPGLANFHNTKLYLDKIAAVIAAVFRSLFD